MEANLLKRKSNTNRGLGETFDKNQALMQQGSSYTRHKSIKIIQVDFIRMDTKV